MYFHINSFFNWVMSHFQYTVCKLSYYTNRSTTLQTKSLLKHFSFRIKNSLYSVIKNNGSHKYKLFVSIIIDILFLPVQAWVCQCLWLWKGYSYDTTRPSQDFYMCQYNYNIVGSMVFNNWWHRNSTQQRNFLLYRMLTQVHFYTCDFASIKGCNMTAFIYHPQQWTDVHLPGLEYNSSLSCPWKLLALSFQSSGNILEENCWPENHVWTLAPDISWWSHKWCIWVLTTLETVLQRKNGQCIN